MKPFDYNIILFYYREILRLKKQSRHLAVIYIGSALNELIIREQAQDYSRIFAGVILGNLMRSKKISNEQHSEFKKIIDIRNKIIHLNANDELFFNLENLKTGEGRSIRFNCKRTEENYAIFESFLKDFFADASKEVLKSLNGLLKSFYPEIFKKPN